MMRKCTVQHVVLSLLSLTIIAIVATADSRKATAAPSSGKLDAHDLSARIDKLITASWSKQGLQPAPLADDAEFFRRLSLDLNGRIPSVVQLNDFLDDTRPDKRRLWIDELLDGPDNGDLYVQHFTNYWSRLLLARTNQQSGLLVSQIEGWVRNHLKANTPYHRLVRDLLTNREAAGFYRANENKPENIAGNTARLFLGVKLECAQCHDDRSGGPWKRTQFWEFAAFFTSQQPAGMTVGAGIIPRAMDQDPGPARIKIPDTDKSVEARFLNGAEPDWKPQARPREVLADWIATADNPWFARAAVNRMWHYFFGIGLIDPLDGLANDDNPPSHPELLQELTNQFIAHDFDLKYLIRAITGSQTYQRTSRQTHDSQKDPRRFARASVRGLTGEQLYDSVIVATGHRGPPSASTDGGPLFGSLSPQAQFLAKFNDPHDQPAEVQTSIQQALFLMNSKFVEELTSLEKSTVLAAVANAGPSRSTAQRIEDLYLATLARKPRPEEAERLVRYVEEGGSAKDKKTALRDVFWALLNSTEFILNH
jgi:hypothetical protein